MVKKEFRILCLCCCLCDIVVFTVIYVHACKDPCHSHCLLRIASLKTVAVDSIGVVLPKSIGAALWPCGPLFCVPS